MLPAFNFYMKYYCLTVTGTKHIAGKGVFDKLILHSMMFFTFDQPSHYLLQTCLLQ